MTLMIKLTPGRKFCLQALAQGDKTGREISIEARAAGLSKRANAEWADNYLPALREAALIEPTGGRRNKSMVHRITEAGRARLAAETPSEPQEHHE